MKSTVRRQWVAEEGGFKHYVSTKLRPEVQDFRREMQSAMNRTGKIWNPTGVTAVVVLFEGDWLSKKRLPRDRDVDNLVKPTLDAVQWATKTSDHIHWELHAYKLASPQESTTVFLFDLGDVVDYYGNKSKE